MLMEVAQEAGYYLLARLECNIWKMHRSACTVKEVQRCFIMPIAHEPIQSQCPQVMTLAPLLLQHSDNMRVQSAQLCLQLAKSV